MAEAAIELIGINKRFGPVHANSRHRPQGQARHHPRHRRRKRRRQIDADVDPLRLLHRRQRRDLRQRQARAHHRFPPCAARSASAWCTSTSCWSTISPSSRTSFSAPRTARCSTASLAQGPHGAEAPRRRIRASTSIPTRIVEDVSVGQQQRVEILKALYRGADILILDEPTGVLTPAEADDLFRVLRAAARAGQDRHPDHPQAARDHGDHRRGLGDAPGRRWSPRCKTAETSPEKLAELMVGRRVLLRVEKGPAHPGKALLEVEQPRRSPTTSGSPRVKGVSFNVRAGEIVGIAGVAGNGQSELLEVDLRHARPAIGRRRRSTASRCRSRATTAPRRARARRPRACARGPPARWAS